MEVLTRREREIVGWIVLGLNNKEIAKKLSIERKSVEDHLTRIFEKCGVKNRIQLALWAVKHNWADEETNQGA